MKKKNLPAGRQGRIQKKRNVLHLRILVPVLILVIILGTAIFIRQTKGRESGIASDTSKPSLQIGTFGMENPPATTTPTPTSVPSLPLATPSPLPQQSTPTPGIPICAGNSGEPLTNAPNCRCNASIFFECKNQQCVRILGENYGGGTGQCSDLLIFGVGDECNVQNITGKKDGYFCVGKPVIYLYPEKPTVVDVKVQTSGKIVVSDPLYPTGGWKNVLAEPDGKLTYLGKNYNELFYESSVKDFGKPTTGITLDSENLRGELDSVITKLGLIGSEKTEFLDWWVPKLQALHSPYIFFSVIEKSEKEKIDHVIYSPEPNTRIEFIAYFKPLQQPFAGKTLDLPATPPIRIGFTAVEWGGILDDK